jgi:hypothetical protein
MKPICLTCFLALLSVLLLFTGCRDVAPDTDKASSFLFQDGRMVYRVKADDIQAIGEAGTDAYLSPCHTVSWVDRRFGDNEHRRGGIGTDVVVSRINTDGKLTECSRVSLPENPLEYKTNAFWSTASKGSIVYVTGELGTGEIAWFDSTQEKPSLHMIPIPEKAKQKAFDDLLIDENTLYAVDNVEKPKWFVLYDISTPLAPKATDVLEMGWAKNSHVIRGALGKRYIALLSSAFWMPGLRVKVTVYDRAENLKPVSTAVLCEGRWMGRENQVNKQVKAQFDNAGKSHLSFAGDWLLISGHQKKAQVLRIGMDEKPKPLFFRNKGVESAIEKAYGLPDGDVVISVGEGFQRVRRSALTTDRAG